MRTPSQTRCLLAALVSTGAAFGVLGHATERDAQRATMVSVTAAMSVNGFTPVSIAALHDAPPPRLLSMRREISARVEPSTGGERVSGAITLGLRN